MTRTAPGSTALGQLGDVRRRRTRYEYDFATEGGAVGAITLRGEQLPPGAVVVDALLRVVTAPTSGGAATCALGLEATGDVQTATAIIGAPWSTTGYKRVSLTASSAPVVTTAPRSPTLTVGTAALTGGRLVVLLEWYVVS